MKLQLRGEVIIRDDEREACDPKCPHLKDTGTVDNYCKLFGNGNLQEVRWSNTNECFDRCDMCIQLAGRGD